MMKNNSGITMVSLVFYVMIFTVIIGIIGSIIFFINVNINGLVEDSDQSVEYEKFNLYILKYVKNGYSLDRFYSDENGTYIKLKKADDIITFTLFDNVLYFNKILLCDCVNEIKVKEGTAENGKQILEILININGKVYTNSYIYE